MSTRHCFLSTCGTSLLTNGRTQHERSLVTNWSNVRMRDEVTAAEAAMLEHIIVEVGAQLSTADHTQLSRLSAELNTLIRYFDGQSFPPHDVHLLLCTDTWLGEEAARLVEMCLRAHGCTEVHILRQKDLQTANLPSFQLALSELVRELGAMLPDYRDHGYRIIFNLTGGFKSVQGFLQSLAPFYADEVIYVFESQRELLRIPRLPVKMNTPEVMRGNLTTFRRLALGLPGTDLDAIPETLLLRIGDEACLSPWGELIWQQTKATIYAERLWPSPSDKLLFGPRFVESVGRLTADRLTLLNERIDDLVCYMERTDHPNPRRLDFKQLRSKQYAPWTHECDAWADHDARRLYGHYDKQLFVLDALDKKLS